MGDTAKYSCHSECIYTREGEPGAQYCFAQGAQRVTCQITTTTPPPIKTTFVTFEGGQEVVQENNCQPLTGVLDKCGMVISGPTWSYPGFTAGPLMFQAYHVVTNEEDFWLDLPSIPSSTNYWLVADRANGTDAQLLMTFSCTKTIRGFRLKNTHNAQYKDRGTANFSISIWDSNTNQWTEVLFGTLPDARSAAIVPVLTFALDDPVTTDKVIFQIDSYYGDKGGGLQYFATY